MELLAKEESAVAEYQPFYAQLAELEQKNATLVFDYQSPKGNKEARSHINTLRLTKGALERTRKSAKEESLRIGRAIDAEAKEIGARIEAMITVHQSAVDEIEQREKERVSELAQHLAELRNIGAAATTAAALAEEIADLEPLVIGDDWQEFKPQALEAKDAVLRGLRQRHGEAVEREKQEAELARLRAEAAERERLEHEAAIVRAAEERARVEAARAAQEAEARAAAEREAAARRELELKLQAENAERRRVEAEQRAEQERVDAIARAERAEQEAKDRAERQAKEAAAAAERQAAEAVRREQDRVAAEQAAAAADLARREANKAHKAKVNRAALAALIAGGLSDECAKQCVTLIASGKVPAVSIAY
jgi:colicin import membrane protein